MHTSKKLRVLVACEYSGIVRDAFLRHGHYAMSCDLEPSLSPSGDHYQGDVLDVINDGWDLMVAHPPCTYLTNCGVRWFTNNADRWIALDSAGIFFRKLLNAKIPYVAVENPIPHKYAVSVIGNSYDQITYPHKFGDKECKPVCLWLKNLPPLKPTKVLKVPPVGSKERKEWQWRNYLPPSPDRGKLRSVFFPGIAEAMATQWPAAIQNNS